jgi:uncharacterized ParB-like nuclease family protein
MRFVTASFVVARGQDDYRVIFEANELGKVDWIVVEKNGEPFGEPFFNGNHRFHACLSHTRSVIDHVGEALAMQQAGRPRHVTTKR